MRSIDSLIEDFEFGGFGGGGSGATSLAGFLSSRGVDWDTAVAVDAARSARAAESSKKYWTKVTLAGNNRHLINMLEELKGIDAAEYAEFDRFRDAANYMVEFGYPAGIGVALDRIKRIKWERKNGARVAAASNTKDALLKDARALADTLDADLSVADWDRKIEAWRIDNGYLWKAVSPRGTVYTEVLRAVTIKDVGDYVMYHAMLEARRRAAKSVT